MIAQQLTLDNVLTGQFALSCCDCISAFVPDEIVYDENAPYLQQVSDEVVSSREFEYVTARLTHIPLSDRGRRYAWRFLGTAVGVSLPLEFEVFRKKARLMGHWARKCGVQFEVLTS